METQGRAPFFFCPENRIDTHVYRRKVLISQEDSQSDASTLNYLQSSTLGQDKQIAERYKALHSLDCSHTQEDDYPRAKQRRVEIRGESGTRIVKSIGH